MDFQSAMETFAEAWVAANSGKIVLSAGSASTTAAAPQASPESRIESPLQQQLGNSKGADGGSLASDYPKIPSGMDLSSSGNTTAVVAAAAAASPPGKRLKGMGNRKLSPSHNNNNNNNISPDFHSSRSTPPLIANSTGKSMPIHCVVEVCSEGSCSSSNNNSGNRRDSILFESASSNNNNGGDSGAEVGIVSTSGTKVVIEVDDFVIIPAGTPFQDVVPKVLTLLGYPKDIIRQAEGTITLRNWKPLRLDQVCDSPVKTVGDILQDLTNHATLRVLVTRAKGGNAEDLKEKLLQLLLAHSSTLLMGAGCPLDEVTVSQLVKGQWPQNLAEDVKRRFDQWYKSLHPGATLGLLESLQHSQLPPHHPTAGTGLIGTDRTSASSIHLPNHHHHGNHLVNGGGNHHHHHHQASLHHPHLPHHPHDLQAPKSSSFIDDDHNHPVFHGITTQKTRMRTSFDPEMELPKLQQWFAENPHPSRHQIQQYVRELNLLECRKDRKPLDVNNVIYWFKNARAAQKRNELRYNGLPSHHQPFSHHHHHHQQQQLTPHHPLLQSSHNMSDRHERNDTHSMELSNGEVHSQLHSAGSSCNSDDQEDMSKDMEKDSDKPARPIKEERDDDYINVEDPGNGRAESDNKEDRSKNNNNEPQNLTNKSPQGEGRGEEEDSGDKTEEGEEAEDPIVGKEEKLSCEVDENLESNPGGEENSNHNTISSSASPRSSPGVSHSPNYDFTGPPSMVNRYHPFFEHPSFMAYRHFNSFNFGPNFPGPNSSSEGAAAYEAALNAARKSLLPGVGKPGSGGLDMFPDFPQGIPSSPLNGRGGGNGSSGNSSNGPGPAGSGGSNDPLSRLRAEELFPQRPASSADIINSIINSNRGEFGPLNLGGNPHHHHHHSPQSSLGLDERRKRNRTFIDPVTEVVLLENWFKIQTHPSHNLILKYTEELNRMPYRQKFPKLEPKNVQFWFKNRRAKCKRLKMNM